LNWVFDTVGMASSRDILPWSCRAVGGIRYGNPELMEALNLADGLARSPASIAGFLEAALELAGKILVRQNPHPRPLSQRERGVRGVQG